MPAVFNMIQQGLLSTNEFSIWLNPNNSQANAGQLILGGRDPSLWTGELTTIPILRAAYWQVVLGGVSVGSSDAGIVAQTAILDSGTTALITSLDDAQSIHSQVSGLDYIEESGIWRVPCRQIPSLPDISFNLGGTFFSVPASIWVQQLTDSVDDSRDACVSSIIPALSSGDPMILGGPFLQAFYTICIYSAAPNNGSTISIGVSAAATAR